MKDDAANGLKSKYNIYSNTIKRFSSKRSRDFACQANYKKDHRRDNCTCKRHKKTQFVHRLDISETRVNFTDFGVERIKLVPKRVKKLYLPDNISINDYCLTKKSSSKCVGGVVPDTSINRKSVAISQQSFYSVEQNRDICSESGCFDVCELNISTHRSANSKTEEINIVKRDTNINISQELSNPNTEVDIIKGFVDPLIIDNEKNFSSDSLIEHIYNLETPSLEKHSRTSITPIENRLEREYRKMFSLKPKHKKLRSEKPIPDIKSVSFMEKSFEALRQGLSWTRDSPKDLKVDEKSSQASVLSHKDVSIASDPPSLEARSISNTNIYSPKVSFLEPNIIKVHDGSVNNRDKEIIKKNECKEIVAQDVKTMFRIWGKKFNFENENLNKTEKRTKPMNLEVTSPEEKRKGNKIFSLFRKKKEKSKDPFKGKNVTTGRCELGDGIVINIGVDNNRTLEPITLKMDNVTKEHSNLLEQPWLSRFISKSVHARKSVQIRWGNKYYDASSSTVFELKDCAYKDTALIFRSKSEISCNVSPFYDNFSKPKVNFMQDIKAWMMPNTICDNPIVTPNSIDKTLKQNNNINISHCNEKGVIEKSKAQNIEFFLHSNNIVRKLDASSEYITINIPEGYFSDDSDYQKQSTDEEVYNIVEYEAQKSKSDIKHRKVDQQLNTGDNMHNDIKVTISVKESHKPPRKTPPQCRDVVIQGSAVYIPNAFDVIGVGIITQKELRHTKKPIIKTQNYLTDEESEHIFQPQKKCELAENFLQEDYFNRYRDIMPLGLDLFTSYANESRLHISSEHNLNKSLNNEGSESCSNIFYDGYQSSNMCSQSPDLCESEEFKRSKFFNKQRKIPILDFASQSQKTDFLKRVNPKDSLEVFKTRKANAASNKSKWGKGGENIDDANCRKPCSKIPAVKKQVTLPSSSSAEADTCVDGILQFKGSGCDTRKSSESLKHTTIVPKPVCEIPQPPCKENCESEKKPPCFKKEDKKKEHTLTPQCKIPYDQLSEAQSQLSSASSDQKCASPQKNLCPPKVESPILRPPCKINSPTIGVRKQRTSSTGSSTQVCKPCCPSRSKERIRSKVENETSVTSSLEQQSSPKKNKCKCAINKNVDANRDMIKTMTTNMRPCPGCAPQETNERRNSNTKECIHKEKFEVKDTSPRSPSPADIGKGCNIRVHDRDGRTLYERRDYKRTTGCTNKDKSSLVRDMYQDSLKYVNRISAANIVNDEKCLDIKEVKSNLSISNVVEINLILKFKQPEKNTDLNHNRCDNRCENYNYEEKSNNQGSIGSPQEIYVFGEEKKQINNDRKDLNLNITIQNLSPKSNSSNKNVSHTYFTTKQSNKNVSTSYSDCVLLHQHAYSVHRATIDVANSIDKLVFVDESTANQEGSYSKAKISTAITSKTSFINYDKIVSKNNLKTSKESISILSDINSSKEDAQNIFNNIQKDYEIARDNSGASESIQKIVSKKLVSVLKKLSRNEKKEVLKQIFETLHNVKEKNKKTKFKRIRHLLHAVLTSESSDFEDVCMSNKIADEITNSSLPSAVYKETESVRSHCNCDSSFTMNISSKTVSKEDVLPTQKNNGISDSNYGSCLCSHIAEKRNTIYNNSNLGCCCRNKNEIYKKLSCLKSNKSKAVEVETQDSRNFKLESVIMTNVSTTMEIQSQILNAPITKQEITCFSNHNTHEIKRINKEKLIYFANDKLLFFLSDSAETIEKDTKYFNKPEDILQLKETKKAVLEIYSQKRISNAKGHITARLPKFVSYKQRQLRPYNTKK